MSCYDPIEKKRGLFSGFVNEFLKLKMEEASDFPPEYIDGESKHLYIREFEEVEGIRLDK